MKEVVVAIVSFMIPVMGCAAVKPPVPPAKATRDEARAALYAGVYGLNKGLEVCKTAATEIAENGDMAHATRLVDLCTDGVNDAAKGADAAKDEIDMWDEAKSLSRVGCSVRTMLPMYAGMIRALNQLPDVPDDTIDGQRRILWLAKQCVGGQ